MSNDDQERSPSKQNHKSSAPDEVNTGGGLYVGGNVATDGGGFTGRDKIRSKTVNVYNAPASPSTLITTTQLFGLIVLLIVAVAVPVVVVLLFWTYLQTHATLTIWLLVAWVFLVLIGSASFITWLEPESHLGQILRGWLAYTFGGYRGKYLQYLIYRHRDFDVKGLSTQGTFTLQLDYVFVELRIAAQNPIAISSNPIHKSLPDLQEQGTLWECLQREAWCYIAILGPPGSGKTTLLKHAVLVLASGRRQRRQLQTPTQLPILLFLRDHIEAITTQPTYNLVMAIEHDLINHGGPPPPPAWFARRLTDGKCLVLLDGLDEVAEADSRKLVSEWVDRQILQFAKNRFVITSRPQGYYTNPLERARALLEVQPFSQPQIEHFVINWYYANEIMSAQRNDTGVTMKAKEGAQDLLQRLRTGRSLADLAVNPLLLTMIATVHRYRSSLPGRRVELYAEVCEVFLGKRQAAKGIKDNLTPAQKKLVLQTLALHLMQSGRRELPGSEVTTILAEPVTQVTGRRGTAEVTAFLDLIEAGSGLLLQREQGIYSFAHLAFQEYLTAVQVVEQKAEHLLLEQLTNPWWHETIRLYSAQADASAIIEGCLKAEEPQVQALVLALQCIEEARQVRPDLRERLIQFFVHGVEALAPARRHLLAEVLLALRQYRLVRVDQQIYIDPTYLTHAEYQLFLDEMQATGQYYQPDHWTQFQFPAGHALLPIIGMRPSDAADFCVWLCKRGQREGWRVRLPQVGELDKYQLEQAEGEQGTARGHWAQTGQSVDYLTDHRPDPGLASQYLVARVITDISFAIILFITSAGVVAVEGAIASALNRNRLLAFALVLDLDLVSALDSALDSASALALALARAFDPARNLTFEPARVRDSAGALVRDLTRASTLARASDRDLALDRALGLANDLARALDLALVLDSANALDSARVLANDLVRARDLASALASAFVPASAFDPANANTLDLAREHALDLARALDLANGHDLALALDLAFALDRARDLVFALARAFDPALASARDRALDLANAYANVSPLARALDRACANTQIIFGIIAPIDTRAVTNGVNRVLTSVPRHLGIDQIQKVFSHHKSPLGEVILSSYERTPMSFDLSGRWVHRWQARLLVFLNLAQVISRIEANKRAMNTLRRSNDGALSLDDEGQAYRDIYVSLAILEARIEGQLPAYEGIRLVWEHEAEQ